LRASTGRRPAWGLWLTWSWRDLRAHWLQVLAIAMVIALGTGSYAGLSSVTRWRRISTDNGYRSLAMYDLRVKLAEGAFLERGQLAAAAAQVSAPGSIAAASERLIAPVQVDASQAGRTILVPGLLYGLDLAGGPAVNALYAATGASLTAADEGRDVVAIEQNFARHYALPDGGSVALSGGHRLPYVGQVFTPEYFFVTTEQGGLLAEANFAAVFTSLTTAGRLSGHPGQVNDLVLKLAPGVDRASSRASLESALRAALPAAGVTVTTRDDDPSFRLNDQDIKGDQQLYDVFAALIFAGAVGAAFNLTARLVEAQRREIGIAMALGVPPARIAVRPLLVGLEIALLGVAAGAFVGWGLGALLMTFVRKLQPLPAWETPFQAGLFGAVAVLGVVLPLVATAWPVWRAVRVAPIAAVQPAYRAAGRRTSPLLRWFRLPGDTFAQVPLRNVLRAPRRTLLTSLGIGAAIAAFVAFVGMIDSFLDTTDRGERVIEGPARAERVEVGLNGFTVDVGREVTAVMASPAVAASEPGFRVGGVLVAGSKELNVQVESVRPDSRLWTPELVAGRLEGARGVYVSELAAEDLGLRVGDSVRLRHPRIGEAGKVTLVEDDLPVLGIHGHPFRFVAYIDFSQADMFGLPGLTNRVSVLPAPGVSVDEVKRALFPLPGVASVQAVGAVADAIRDLLEEFVVILRVVEGAMLLIAFLIALNAAAIGMDERRREHATMFAFGVPVSTVLRMAMVENLVIGLAATALGVAGGRVLLDVIMRARVRDTFPDIDIRATIGTETLIIAVSLGVAVVTLAPLLVRRSLTRMDVPSTLKVME
jgi:putative ABC transport system permease protein